MAVAGLSGVVAIAAYGQVNDTAPNHTCALTSAGAVKCWGSNSNGQLGTGAAGGTSTSPVDVSGLGSGVAAIAVGSLHSCALTSAGEVKCWGVNNNGQVGDTTTTQRPSPTTVSGLGSGVTAIAANEQNACALLQDGEVRCWGNGSLAPVTQTGLGGAATAITVGAAHYCAIVGGGAKCWGKNHRNQLGNTAPDPSPPVDVFGLSSGVVKIRAGYDYACAVTAAGALKCWGDNQYGQAGLGATSSNRNLTTDPYGGDVAGLASGALDVSGGLQHTCALTVDGSVRCWGRNSDGRVGNGAALPGATVLVPVPPSGLTSAIATASASAGRQHTCARTAAGGVACWGRNVEGQLGNGATLPGPAIAAVPVTIAGLSGVTTVASGAAHTCALLSGGAVKCWGANSDGQLGNNSTTGQSSAVDVHTSSGDSTPLAGVLAIATGESHTCALMTGGGVKCWGSNSRGQLGNNVDAGGQVSTPVDVQSAPGNATLLMGASAISAGEFHNCAVVGSGAKCWGYNNEGQLGNGTLASNNGNGGISAPVDVVGILGAGLLTGVTAVASGAEHSCAIVVGDEARCWGRGNLGQLGNTAGTNSLTPVILREQSGTPTPSVAAIDSGAHHSCVAISTGHIKCWGLNDHGQLGNGTLTNSPFATLARAYDASTSGVVLSAGAQHTCATTTTGLVRCWGANADGQLGDSTAAERTSPAEALLGSQSLVFTSPAPLKYQTAVGLSATALSALPATFDTWTPATCGISGTTVTPTVVGGLCGLRATQTGNGDFRHAPQQLYLLSVGKGDQAITFNPVGTARTYSPGGTFTVDPLASASSGLAVNYVSTTPLVCTLAGHPTPTTTTTVTIVAAGDCIIAANQPGNGFYNAAPQVLQTTVIGKASQSITWNPDPLPNKILTDPPFSVSASATVSPVAFASTTGTVCSVTADGATVTLLALGTCTLTANQSGNDNYNAAPQVTRSFQVDDGLAPDTTITSAPPALTNSTTADFSFTSTEAGTFECKLDAGAFTLCTTPKQYTSLAHGAHTFQVRAIDAANNTDPTPASHSWTVDTAAPALAITSKPAINAANQAAYSIAGTCSEDGRTVNAQIGSIATTGTCGTPSSGQYSTIAVDASGLALGTVALQVSTTDLAGNSTTVNDSTTKDIAGPALTLDALDIITFANRLAYGFSGTCETGGGNVGYTLTSVASVNGSVACSGGGTFTVSALNVSTLTDGTVNFAITQADSVGNPGNAGGSVLKDTGNPLVTFDTPVVINNANKAAYTLSGTCSENTRAVSVTVGGTVNAAPTCTGGAWTASSLDVSAVADGPAITLSALHTDAVGNSATANTTVLKDTGPPVLAFNALNAITFANRLSYGFSGSCETGGSNVGYTLTSGASVNGSVACSAGAFTVSALDVSTLTDGTVTFAITQTDAVGNPGNAGSSATKDTGNPTMAFDALATINAANQNAYSVSGTCSESGQVVSVTIGGTVNVTPTCSGGGTFSATGINVSSVADGPSVTVAGQHTDTVGNVGSANATVVKDTAGPTLTFNALSPITFANRLSYGFSGTCETGGSTVGYTLTSVASVNGSVACSAGIFTVSALDVSTLTDGTVTFAITQTDPVGNPGNAGSSATKDTVGPSLAFNALTTITFANRLSYGFSGSCEAGSSTVSYTLTSGASVNGSVACSGGGTFTVSALDVSSLTDGTVTFAITQTDAVGNLGNAGSSATKDTVNPTMAFGTLATITAANQNAYSVSGTCSENGRVVSVTIGGTVNVTPTCTVGTFSAAGIDVSSVADGPSVAVAGQHTSTVGNVGTANATVVKDTGAPALAITSKPAINAANQAAYSIAGTCSEDGRTVNAQIGSIATTGTCGTPSSGQYSTIAVDASGLALGTVALQVSTTDLAGNSTTVNDSTTKDIGGPVLTLDALDVITNANRLAYSFSGTCETGGSNVGYTLTSGASVNGSVACSGGGTFTVSALNVSTLTDGTVNFAITQADSAGNPGNAGGSVLKDTGNPLVTFDTPVAINNANKAAYTLSGTCSENGRVVSVTVGGTLNATPNCAGGAWMASNLDVSAFTDGPAITLSALHSDTAGNSATANTTVLKDVLVPAAPAVTAPAGTITTTTPTVTGTSEANASISVRINGNPVGTTTATGTSWSFPLVTPLPVGVTHNASATATDAAGNVSAASANSTFFIAPTVVVAPTTLPGGTVAVAYNQAISASGGAPAYSYAVTAGALPGGLTLTPSGVGAGTLAGTPTAAGSFNFTVTATDADVGNGPFTGARAYTVVIAQGSQTITFNAQAGQTFVPGGTFAISPLATASPSGLTPTYSSTTTGVCTVSGTTVTMVSGGTCTIAANQAGNVSYSAAPQVTQSVAIAKANQSITFNAQTATPTFSVGGTFAINPLATASSGLGVAYTSTTAGTCTVSGTTITIVAAGNCTVAANQAGSVSYNAAAQVTQTVAIAKANQTISFTPPGQQTLQSPTVNLSATTTSGLVAQFATLTPAVCTVSGIQATMVAVGTCTVRASQAGNTNYNAAANVDGSFQVVLGATVPGAPTIGTGTPGNGQAIVAFTPPASNGGSAILDYRATCSPGGATQVAAASPITVTGLTNGTQYSCSVTARNAVGSGAASATVAVTPRVLLVRLSPASLDFGGQSMGTTSPAITVTVTNETAGSITISSVTPTAQFQQTNTCTSAALAPLQSCAVQVFFSPAASGAALGSATPVAGTLSIASNASGSPHTAPLAGSAEKSLVTHYYRSILRRAPDAGGKTFWEGEATRVAGLGASVNEVWFAMAQAFYFSAEYGAFNRNNTAFATDLYNTFFNRTPDSGGLGFWVGLLDSGMPREVALASFMFSTEFGNFTTAIFGNVTARAEVNAIVDFYRGLLARTPDSGGFGFWVGRFRAAQCQNQAAVIAEVEAISSAFALSAEYSARARTDAQYVGDLYNAFLRRGGDLAGVNFWIGQVTSGAQTREQVRIQFKNSAEFQARVNAIIAQGCQ